VKQFTSVNKFVSEEGHRTGAYYTAKLTFSRQKVWGAYNTSVHIIYAIHIFI